jgi:hypothetical protein
MAAQVEVEQWADIGYASGIPEGNKVTVDKNHDRFRVEIDCGDLQPARRVWSEVFYIGKGTSGELVASGQVFAENLPQPMSFSLAMTVNVRITEMSLDELTELPEPSDSDE